MRRTALYAQLRPELVLLHARTSGRGLNAVGTVGYTVTTCSMLQPLYAACCTLSAACCPCASVAVVEQYARRFRLPVPARTDRRASCVTQGSKWSCVLHAYSQCAVVLVPPASPSDVSSLPLRIGRAAVLCSSYAAWPHCAVDRMRCLHGTPMSLAKRRTPTRSRSAQRTTRCAA